MKIKKAFTLVEILMVTLILGILVWVLFKVYVTMSQISFRVEQQKIVNQELLFVSEVLQNFANRNNIDYNKYGTGLVDTDGMSDVLYLTWEDGEMSIYSSGNCVSINEEVLQENLNSGCNLILQRWWDNIDDIKIIKLTNDLVYTTQVLFKVVPFVPEDVYIDDIDLCDSNYLACIYDPGFWIMMKMYNRWYNQNVWANEISIHVHQFFNI